MTGFEGFEEWFGAEHRRLVGSLIAVDGDLDAARDAAAEAFAGALVHSPRVHSIERPGPWLYRVALNVQRRRLRRARLEARLPGGGRGAELPGRNWVTRFNVAWYQSLGVYRLSGTIRREHRMPRGERCRRAVCGENRTHGSTGGCWRRGRDPDRVGR